jgi:hypothetical protein
MRMMIGSLHCRGAPFDSLEADVARNFLAELMDHKELRGLLSDEHFSVDSTQIAACGQGSQAQLYGPRAESSRRW